MTRTEKKIAELQQQLDQREQAEQQTSIQIGDLESNRQQLRVDLADQQEQLLDCNRTAAIEFHLAGFNQNAS